MYGKKLEEIKRKRAALLLKHEIEGEGKENTISGKKEPEREEKKIIAEERHIVVLGTAAAGYALKKIEEDGEALQGLNSQFVKIEAEKIKLISGENFRKMKEIALENAEDVRIGGEGGIFASLWDVCTEYGTGLKCQLPKIPISSLVIELCEDGDTNPYLADYSGSIIAVTTKPEKLLEAVKEYLKEKMEEKGGETNRNNEIYENLLIAEIGHLISGPEKMIINGDEVRSLSPDY